MNLRAVRLLALLDILGIPILTAWMIWRPGVASSHRWIILPVWVVASFLLHRDTPKTLGWRVDNLWPASRRSGVIFAGYAAALIVFGLTRSAPRITLNSALLRHLLSYTAFCLLQQVALNSLLNNRLIALVRRPWVSSLLAGLIFSSLHWPNPVLVPVTLLGGITFAWLFRRERNILPLALGQAFLGAMVGWAFPVAWHHQLRVGPGYSEWPS